MQPSKLLSADRIGGLIWLAFGAAVIYGSWVMDRLVSLGIPPATAPGVPTGLLGVCFIGFALVLLFRSGPPAETGYAPTAAEASPAAHRDNEFQWRRLALSWVLCMTYGLLLGGGMAYWLLTGVFLFLHLMLLDESERVPAVLTARRLLIAAILAPATAVIVSQVFQRLFLVRLP
jgi:hypothetical protein